MTVIATAIPAAQADTGRASTRTTQPVQFAWFEYEGSEVPTVKPQADEFLNPILAGSHPDPSICRVGDDYFLINSTFAWYPGIPIFRSTDLVNWTQIGHVLDRPSQLNLEGRGVSEGVFAPTIQHHDGLFFVVSTIVGGGGNFYVTANDPAGPWSEPHWLKEVKGIDPSLFFDDDGRVYLAHNGEPPDNKPLYSGHRAIWLHEFDREAGTTRSGSAKIIVNGGTDLTKKPVWVEGPHLFKRNGFYYLCCAEGGTGRAHAQVIFRSRDVWGPYKPFERPILTQRHLPADRADAVWCTGHADLVETQTGEWWAVFLGSRYYEGTFTNMDRETFLLPLRWADGWPIILDGDEAVSRVLKRPPLPAQPPTNVPHNGSFSWRDDFDAPTLAPVWNFLRTPHEAWYSLSEKPGSLLLVPRPVELSSRQNPSLIARRQQHAHFSATVQLTPGDDPGADAGLVVFRNARHYFFLASRIDAQHEGGREIFLECAAGKSTPNGPEVVARAALPSKAETIEFKVTGEGRQHSFSYRVADGDWVTLKNDADASSLSTDIAGGFVGTYIGMYARLQRHRREPSAGDLR